MFAEEAGFFASPFVIKMEQAFRCREQAEIGCILYTTSAKGLNGRKRTQGTQKNQHYPLYICVYIYI